MNSPYRNLICFIDSIIVICGFSLAWKSSLNESGKIFGVNYNLFTYVVVVLTAFVIYGILAFVLMRPNVKVRMPRAVQHAIDGVVGIATIIYFLLIYKNETTQLFAGNELLRSFIREKVNHVGFVVFIIPAIIGIVCAIFWGEGQKLPGHFRVVSAFTVSALGGVFSYAPNLFKNQMWGLYHIHAYTNSIVGVLNFQPYNEVNCSIYGHYGLIYLPFVKLLGNDTDAIMLTISLFAMVTYLATAYVLHKTIKNDLLYTFSLTGIIGTTTTYFSAGNYFQIMPHRCIFPALMAATVAWIETHENVKLANRLFLEMAIGTIAVIFNLETGLVVLASIFIYEIIKNSTSFSKFLIHIGTTVIESATCFILAYMLVNVYNLVVGGEWNSIRMFIYPIGSEQYNMSEILKTPIQNPFTAYTFQIIVFILTTFSALYKLLIEKTKEKILNYELLVLGMSGLSSLVYFMNRSAASCLSISHLQMTTILFIVADRFTDISISRKSKKNHGDSEEKYYFDINACLACGVAAFLGIESIISIGLVMVNRAESTWSIESVNEDYEQAQLWIPEGISAFGMGVPEIYFQCGKNPQVYLTDWAGADMTPVALSYVYKMLGEQQEVVISKDTLDREDVRSMLNEYKYYECNRLKCDNFTLVHFKR